MDSLYQNLDLYKFVWNNDKNTKMTRKLCSNPPKGEMAKLALQIKYDPPKLTSLVLKLLPLKIAEHVWVYHFIIFLLYFLIFSLTPHDLPHQF